MKKFIIWLFFTFTGVFLFSTYAGKQVFTPPSVKKIKLFYDQHNQHDINSILERRDSFELTDSKVPNIGVIYGTMWAEISIDKGVDPETYFLKYLQPTTDVVNFYVIEDNEVLYTFFGGDANPDQITGTNRNIFKLDFLQDFNDKDNQFFIQLKGGEHIHLPLELIPESALIVSKEYKNIFVGIYIGIILSLFLYNLFIYITVKDNGYVLYVAYLFIVGVTQLNFMGYASDLLWDGNLLVSTYAVYILSSLTAVLALAFMRVLLNLPKEAPHLNKYVNVFYIAYAVVMVVCLLGYLQIAYVMIQIVATIAATYMLIVGIVLSLNQYRPAYFFLVAWSVFLIGVTLYTMKDFGILPYNQLSVYTMPIGTAIEVILLSFALADRINLLKKEKEQSQMEALRESRLNEKLVKEQYTLMEEKVKERTTDLQRSKNELESALLQLQDAQTNLVESEKMASLGQLTAGIAHEINNPINFVSSNIYPLRMDIDDLFQLVDTYGQLDEGADLKWVKKQAEQLKKDINIDFLKSEVTELLNGIEDGANRTAEIVKGLKTFSYLDEAEFKPANLNDGITSTLVLLRSSIDPNIEVVTMLESLPMVECYPGKMNQVFMNVISNAIQAIDVSSRSEKECKVTIKSSISGNMVVFEISDTGVGISDEIKSKVFDPFFTTKDVGKGTGLGLSIVYSIIKKHNGHIQIDSTPGMGTTFTLKIPLKQPK
jgi:signal transduction histidine kinase